MKVLMRVQGVPISLLPDGSVSFSSGLTVDADGAPNCYHPDGRSGLDYLANAGHPGNWWGIATDKRGIPYIQGPQDPAPGFYVSTTALQLPGFEARDPRRYVDSNKVPFIVVPNALRHLVGPVVLGCRCTVTCTKTGRTVEGVVADIGPATHLGEASIAMARKLGLPYSPKNGGVVSGCIYQLFPGEQAVLDGVTYPLTSA